ncbi:hypothetical protein AS9A_4284 [Hoyosella subflava DQS3-9A1]|uniref:Uncharacterized protein n=1 Tax=Hoyosella subflava (strain DSM 45089 / JCM 17490 / NBRC 109087 / DQS3-9A1) TaxID=443218 RepID=F6EL54_HOYSD|nr:hypothetical protein AS9A_4284 [Hoyosella subflava DQS3-9A1]
MTHRDELQVRIRVGYADGTLKKLNATPEEGARRRTPCIASHLARVN